MDEKALKDLVVGNIERIRESRGLTQNELAERAGINPRTYQQFVYYGVFPRPKYLTSLSETLSCSLVEFFMKHNEKLPEIETNPKTLLDGIAKQLGFEIKSLSRIAKSEDDILHRVAVDLTALIEMKSGKTFKASEIVATQKTLNIAITEILQRMLNVLSAKQGRRSRTL
jgi:transcriptional regulator with XRE-family HTH domain